MAMRRGSVLNYLLGDHLGSNSLSVDNVAGSRLTELRYKAWGESRTAQNPGRMPTSYAYTGQRRSEAGLYFYEARFYDPALGRFTQPDSIIPEASQGVQAWDRYAGMNNNPVRYNDPSGHCAQEGDDWCHERKATPPKDMPPLPPYNPLTWKSPAACPITGKPVCSVKNDYTPPLLTNNDKAWLASNKANLLDRASDATSIVPVILQGVERGSSPGVPLTVVGGVFAASAEYQRGEGADSNQRIYNSIKAGGTSIGVSTTSGLIAVIPGMASSIINPALGAGVYILT